MSIELQFVLGADWTSKLIAWYGNGYGGYSHVDAVMPDGALAGARSDVVGNKPAGFQIRPAKYASWKRCTRVSIPCNADKRQRWLDLIEQKVGAAYDKADIVGLVIGRRLETNGAWICSAAQTDLLQAIALLPTPFPFIKQQITPNTLLAMCCSIGGATYGDAP